jgi:hypothetical protein
MSPSLAAFQSGLCRALRGEDTAPLNANSAGFIFTARVRRTWCERRAFAAARQVLLLAPAEQRRRLVMEYVDAGGGLALFLPTESESFLPFLAARLPDPSHALTVCRMSMALARAQSAAASFVPPAASACRGWAKRGRFASLVWFHADPALVMAALRGAAPPPLGPRTHAVLFAPGLPPEMFRVATEAEAALWESLPARGGPAGIIARLAREGAVELAA